MKKPTVEERRTEILETTCEVVIERGFAATRIADVAKRLGVSSSLIHYHFESKEQLLAEAFSHYARKDLAEMEAEVEAAPTAVAQLDRAIQNYVPEGSGDVEWMLWIDAWGEALRNPLMKAISQELRVLDAKPAPVVDDVQVLLRGERCLVAQRETQGLGRRRGRSLGGRGRWFARAREIDLRADLLARRCRRRGRRPLGGDRDASRQARQERERATEWRHRSRPDAIGSVRLGIARDCARGTPGRSAPVA